MPCRKTKSLACFHFFFVFFSDGRALDELVVAGVLPAVVPNSQETVLGIPTYRVPTQRYPKRKDLNTPLRCVN